MSTVPTLASFVGGEWRPGTTETPDYNPARSREVVALTSLADAALVGEAVDAAADAWPRWHSVSAAARGQVLRKAGDLLEERAAAIARDLTREQGKTLDESLRETRLAADIFRYYATQALDPDGETYPSNEPDMIVYVKREPLGVVTVITPWNFPISIPAWKLGPALAFGNAVAWKPAEIVPLTAVHLVEALVDAGVPDGVLNLVLGKGSTVGDPLVDHPAVAAVTFTGSNPVGRRILERAGAAGKRVQLELGGKNPAVVLADADLGLAAGQISRSAFGGAGQKCTATSRVIVERSVADDLVERLELESRSWILGDPLDDATTLGPLASNDQLESVLGFLDQAAVEGVKAVAGGGRADGPLADGCYVEPTVLVDVEPDHTVAREEIFGPVVAVIQVDSYEEAVGVANDTPFGLSASVFTRDLATAMRFTSDSRTGLVRVNRGTSGVQYHVPFGGAKDSSFGPREQGKAAQQFFTESKTVYLGWSP